MHSVDPVDLRPSQFSLRAASRVRVISRQYLYLSLTVPPRPSTNGAPIEQVTTAKSLGVLIDNNLTWRSHIDKLTKKIASGIGAIKRVRHLVPYGTLHSIHRL